MIVVDKRWSGNFGIGRYSREVTDRLSAVYPGSFDNGLHPTSKRSIIRSALSASKREQTLYTPGYAPTGLFKNEVLTIHDLIHLDVEGGLSRFGASLYYARVVRPAIKAAGLAITVSETSKQRIIDWLGDPGINVVNCGNGCSPAFFESADAPFDANRIVFVGNSKVHKNWKTLFEALVLLPDLRLAVIAGDIDSFSAYAEELGIRNRIDFHSGIEDRDLAALYSTSLLTVMPSEFEGFGLPALESLACGRPVVYWEDCWSVAEIVGTNGVSVEREYLHNPEAWAMAIMKSASVQISCDARQSIRAKYSWENVARRVQDTLECTYCD